MNLIPFNFNGAPVRVVTDEHGEPWFVGKDVCDLLGYANPSDAMGRHCKGVVKRYPLQTQGGLQDLRILSEGDTLRMIVNSTMPAAQVFESWVFDEVLPTIRKTGSYQRPLTPAEQALAQAQVMVDLERRQSQQQAVLEHVERRVSSVEQVRYLDSRPAGFESMTSIRERVNLRHGIPQWVINAVMRDVPGAPLPFAMVRSKHADDGAQPYAIWPIADITRRFDRFVSECTYQTEHFATHPDIQQGRFKLCRRKAL